MLLANGHAYLSHGQMSRCARADMGLLRVKQKIPYQARSRDRVEDRAGGVGEMIVVDTLMAIHMAPLKDHAVRAEMTLMLSVAR